MTREFAWNQSLAYSAEPRVINAEEADAKSVSLDM